MRRGKAYQPSDVDRKHVKLLAGFGLTQRQIALLLDVSLPTLRRAFAREMEIGKLDVDAEVMAALFRKARSGDVRACALWLGRRPEWRPLAPLGKKDQAELDAVAPERGTHWDGLLN